MWLLVFIALLLINIIIYIETKSVFTMFVLGWLSAFILFEIKEYIQEWMHEYL
jgi:hypothetical protein